MKQREVHTKFHYFLECYFNQSFDYEELSQLATDFRDREREETVLKFLDEIATMRKDQNWQDLQLFVKKYGGRKLSEEKVIGMLDILLDKLTK